jgi:hypothetical protein
MGMQTAKPSSNRQRHSVAASQICLEAMMACCLALTEPHELQSVDAVAPGGLNLPAPQALQARNSNVS